MKKYISYSDVAVFVWQKQKQAVKGEKIKRKKLLPLRLFFLRKKRK